jgi:hypothetical protein
VLHPPKTVNHYPAKSRITTLHMYFPHSHVLCTHTADLRSAVQAKGQTEAPAAGFRRTTDSALRTVRYAGPRIQHRLHDAHGSSSIGRKKKKKKGRHACAGPPSPPVCGETQKRGSAILPFYVAELFPPVSSHPLPDPPSFACITGHKWGNIFPPTPRQHNKRVYKMPQTQVGKKR